jgi:hypothetical protein
MKTMSHMLAAAVMLTLCSAFEAAAEDSFTVSEFTFSTPKGWTKQTPKSRMRAAQLSAPGKDGAEAAEVTFFYFGEGGGGGIDANKQRWLGQFKDRTNDKEVTKEVNGTKVAYISTEGTFMSGPPFGEKVAKKEQALLGAIMQGKKGLVFVKMTGPKATTQAAGDNFKIMVEKAMK